LTDAFITLRVWCVQAQLTYAIQNATLQIHKCLWPRLRYAKEEGDEDCADDLNVSLQCVDEPFLL